MLALSKEESHHLVRVRRARAGDSVELLDGHGRIGTGEIVEVSGKQVSVRLDSVIRPAKPEIPIRLCLAFPKSKVFEAVLQKSVELGVAEIVPLATEHADPALAKADEPSRRDRWQQILVEAMKQSGNSYLPLVTATRSLAEVLAGDAHKRLRICAALKPDAGSLWRVLEAGVDEEPEGIDLFVGPEGDFSQAEYLNLAESCRFFSLGGPVLRVETAAVSVIAIVQEALRWRGEK